MIICILTECHCYYLNVIVRLLVGGRVIFSHATQEKKEIQSREGVEGSLMFSKKLLHFALNLKSSLRDYRILTVTVLSVQPWHKSWRGTVHPAHVLCIPPVDDPMIRRPWSEHDVTESDHDISPDRPVVAGISIIRYSNRNQISAVYSPIIISVQVSVSDHEIEKTYFLCRNSKIPKWVMLEVLG